MQFLMILLIECLQELMFEVRCIFRGKCRLKFLCLCLRLNLILKECLKVLLKSCLDFLKDNNLIFEEKLGNLVELNMIGNFEGMDMLKDIESFEEDCYKSCLNCC